MPCPLCPQMSSFNDGALAEKRPANRDPQFPQLPPQHLAQLDATAILNDARDPLRGHGHPIDYHLSLTLHQCLLSRPFVTTIQQAISTNMCPFQQMLGLARLLDVGACVLGLTVVILAVSESRRARHNILHLMLA